MNEGVRDKVDGVVEGWVDDEWLVRRDLIREGEGGGSVGSRRVRGVEEDRGDVGVGGGDVGMDFRGEVLRDDNVVEVVRGVVVLGWVVVGKDSDIRD